MVVNRYFISSFDGILHVISSQFYTHRIIIHMMWNSLIRLKCYSVIIWIRSSNHICKSGNLIMHLNLWVWKQTILSNIQTLWQALKDTSNDLKRLSIGNLFIRLMLRMQHFSINFENSKYEIVNRIFVLFTLKLSKNLVIMLKDFIRDIQNDI